MNEIIRVTQLPIIEEHLRSMKETVDKRAEEALSLVCTEDTVQAVKAVRADLNKEFQALEVQRKEVKKAVLGPYEQFEATYKECISDAYKCADAALKGKIVSTEQEIKHRCEDSLREYFAELCEAEHIGFIRYEQAGVKIDMASAKQKTPRKLREQVAAFVVRLSKSVDLIAGMDNADEIMVEYKRTLDVSEAIASVRERHRRLEAEKEAQALREVQRVQEAEAVAKVEVSAPLAAEPAEQVFHRFTFTVFDAAESQLVHIREFLKQEGIRYE